MTRITLSILFVVVALGTNDARASREDQCQTWKAEIEANEFNADPVDFTLRERGCVESGDGWVPGSSRCERLAFRLARRGWMNDIIFPRMTRADCVRFDNGSWRSA